MLVQLKNLRKDYSRNGQRFAAVDTVSLQIAQGDFITITGQSGSGKTTLLNMIAGLLTPTQGHVLIDGIDVFSLSDGDMAHLRNQQIGYIPQGSSLLANLTALENIRLPLSLTPRDTLSLPKALALMTQAGIADLADTYPAQMSGGEMRRVAVIRSLICSPNLLIADEPTSDLDDENSHLILNMLKAIHQQGTAILVVTHDKQLASHAERRYNMQHGRLLSC